MRTTTEIQRAMITLLCAAYDKGLSSAGYVSADDTIRNIWVKKQMENIGNWFDKTRYKTIHPITKDWFTMHNFENLFGDTFSYKGGGKDFSFIVEKADGKWYAKIGKGFIEYNSCGLEYTEEIEDIFLLLTGKEIYYKPS